MCVVCVAGEVDSVRAKYGTWDTHGEAFTLLHERTFTSPGPWPLSVQYTVIMRKAVPAALLICFAAASAAN